MDERWQKSDSGDRVKRKKEKKKRYKSVVLVEALMQTMLIQEQKDNTITHTVHEILTWFSQQCLCPQMKENHSTIL